MSKVDFKEFRADYDKAMEALKTKYGINMKVGTITYDDMGFRFKSTMSYQDLTPEDKVASYPSYIQQYIGKEITIGVKKYKVVGYNARKHKYPYEIEDAKGKLYITSRHTVEDN